MPANHETQPMFDKNGNVTTQARWVADGEGMAYRSFLDGISFRLLDGKLWQYTEAIDSSNEDTAGNVTYQPQGKLANGKEWGWIKIPEDSRHNSKARKYLDYLSQEQARRTTPMADGIYILTEEHGQPEFVQRHEYALPDAPRTYQALADYFRARPGLSAIKFQHNDYAPVLVTRADVGIEDETPAEAEAEESPTPRKPRLQDAPTKIIRREPKAKSDSSDTDTKTKEENTDASSSDNDEEKAE